MADSRIHLISGEVLSAELSALLNSLYFAVDSTGFTEAKKILLKTFLTEAAVVNEQNNWQAMTPKAFYTSVMTEIVSGINRLATNAEITGKTTTALIGSNKQSVMQTQWLLDWFNQPSSAPAAVAYHTNSRADQMVMDFPVNVWRSFNTAEQLIVNPTLNNGRVFSRLYLKYVIWTGSNNTHYQGTTYIDQTGVDHITGLSGSSLNIGINASGSEFSLRNAAGATQIIKASMQINAILK